MLPPPLRALRLCPALAPRLLLPLPYPRPVNSGQTFHPRSNLPPWPIVSSRPTLPSPVKPFFPPAFLPQVKEEITEIVQFLRDPARFLSLGARSPAGMLLVGPPGGPSLAHTEEGSQLGAVRVWPREP